MSLLETPPSPDEEKAVYSKVTRRIIPFLLLCFCVAFIDRVNVGFAHLQMEADLGLSAAAFGLGAGIFFIGYLVFEVPSNLLMTRIGAKKTMSRIMVLWGITSVCMMFVDSPATFYILRFLLGAFEAGFAPGLLLYLTYWYSTKRRAKIMALILVGIPVSGVIGGPLSGAILSGMDEIGGLAGWQWMFLIEGVPALILGFLVWKVLADNPADATWLDDREKAVVTHTIEEDRASHGESHSSFRVALKDRRVWTLAFVYFAISAGAYLLSFWLPTILKGLGSFSTWEIGLLVAIPYGFAAVVMLLNALHSDKTQERRWHLIAPGLLGIVGLLATMQVSSPVFSMFYFSLATAGILATMPIFWSLPPQWLTGLAAAGGIAVINSLGNVGGFVAPYLMGELIDRTGSTNAGLYTLSVLLFLGLAATLSLRHKAEHRVADAPTVVTAGAADKS